MLASLGLLVAASLALPGEAALAARLTCGTFEAQSHDNYAKCDAQVCWGDDGRPRPPVATDEVLTVDSPGGFFKHHYTLSGVNAVPLTDLDLNGIPDYIDHFVMAFDDGLAALRELGFRDPQPDRRGGDARLDVYYTLAGGVGGAAYWDEHSPNTRPEYPGSYPVFIAINPVLHAMADEVLPAWMGELLIRQVAIHELHHAVQLGYGNPGASWVIEGMSVMIEQVVLDLPRKLPFVTDFRYDNRYRHPEAALLQSGVTRLGYANGLFYTALLQDLGGSPGGLVAYWDAIGQNAARDYSTNNPVALVTAGLAAAGLGTIPEAFRRHTLRSLFIGEYDDGEHYADGFRYHPPEGAIRTAWIEGEGVQHVASLEKYSYAVYQVERPAAPVQLAKPAAANAEWDWVRQHADCTTSVTALDPLATAVTLPAEADDTRGWLVVRHVGAAPANYALRFTAPVRPETAEQGALHFLDAPTSPTAGREGPIVLRYDGATCRRVDATETAVLTTHPAGAAEMRAGGALRFTQAGDVTVRFAYAGAVTERTFTVAPDAARVPPGYASGGGCQSGRGGGSVVWVALLVGWLGYKACATRVHRRPISRHGSRSPGTR